MKMQNVPNVPVPNCPAFGKINEREGHYVEDYCYLCQTKTVKRMKQSHFEQMERPYPVITYGKEVATLVATLVEEEVVPNEQGGTRRVIHRRPVVSHEYCKEDSFDPAKGVVWDQVEVESVTTLFTEDQDWVGWRTFERLVGMRLYNSTVDEPQTDATYALSLLKRFDDLAVEVLTPYTDGIYCMVLGRHDTGDDSEWIIDGSIHDVRGFGDHEVLALANNFPLWAKGNPEEVYETMRTEMESYLSIIGEDAQFSFVSIEPAYQTVADRLNQWMGV